MNRSWIRLLIGLALVAIIMVAGLSWSRNQLGKALNPAPETIVSASLQGLREQNRLSAFVASYVAVVTTSQSRFGLSAQRTLIMPGLVRYEVDLGRLTDGDIRWDATAGQLFVTLPPVEVVGPQIDLTRIREYDNGGLLLKLGDTSKTFDLQNRKAGQAELLRQAREPVPISLAKDATRRAVERSFALPLRAAGMDAVVRVRFADEKDYPSADHERMDRSRSLNEVYGKPAR